VYPFAIDTDGEGCVIRLSGVLAALVAGIEAGETTSEMALCFHATVARMTLEVCERIAEEVALRTVALSGGCFQNRLLLVLTVPALRRAGFQVLLHRQVPCNDGGLSLGQAAIAHFGAQRE
jgi:hydrogenase maturation protein HypF